MRLLADADAAGGCADAAVDDGRCCIHCGVPEVPSFYLVLLGFTKFY